MNKLIHMLKKHAGIGVFVLLALSLLFVKQNLLATGTLSYHPVVGAVTGSEAAIYAKTDSSAQIQVIYSQNPDLSSSSLAPTSPITTSPERDNIAHISLTNLTPNTKYYYSVLINGTRTAIYNFTTFPTTTEVKDFSFAVFSDSDINGKNAVFQTAGQENPSFVLQLGDFSHANPASAPDQLIQDWWSNNKGALVDSFYGTHYTLNTSIPFVHIWDDHDYGANGGNKSASYKSVSTQAFLDYFPIYNRPNPSGGLWHSFRYAQTEFFILDLRSQKDPATITDDANKSMLDGDLITNDQKTWLKQQLLNSTAKWKFIGSSLTWNPTVPKAEAWAGFRTEQNELINFINNNNITGVIFLSGDIHSGGGVDNGTNSFFPEINIPNSNKGPTGCSSGGDCGTWSHGIINPSKTQGGYVSVRVKNNTEVEFTVKDYYGKAYKIATLNEAGTLTNIDYPDPSQYSITVTVPNGGDIWGAGTDKTIKWTHTTGNVIETFTKVELSRNNGTTWETLADAVPNTTSGGSYTWSVTGPATNTALIRVSTLNGAISDVSDSSFVIESPYITVTNPDTSVTWGINSIKRIKWSHNLGKYSYVDIYVSRDGGLTWALIASNIKNGRIAGNYDWTVSGPATNAALIKVKLVGSTLQDVSNTTFKIQ